MSSDLSPFATTIFNSTYRFHPTETWNQAAHRVVKWVAGTSAHAQKAEYFLANRELMLGGRYLYGAGRAKPQNNNCFLLRAEDSAVGWARVMHDALLATSKGGGVGTNYSDIRPRGSTIHGYGGQASGPVSLMKALNEQTRELRDGAGRRGALWAGLHWNHADVPEMVATKDWDIEATARKMEDPMSHAPLDQTNISVELDDEFFRRIDEGDKALWATFVGWMDSALRTGEPGFSINLGDKWMENLRNPCCEVVSEDNGDVCNLGSVNFARIRNLGHLEEVTRSVTQMLLRGTEVGWLPEMIGNSRGVRTRNRRIGVGLMGLHDWCVQNDLPYGPSDKLGEWLDLWRDVSEDEATRVAADLGINRPKGVRAIAPTGTIGILAETSTGIEPMFASAYKRSFLRDGEYRHQYVIDPIARTALEHGVDPADIEDATSLSSDIERRLAMQAFVQERVDMAISSTINLPQYGAPGNDDTEKIAGIVYQYLPKLRGLTIYPDGARSGQPLQKVSIEEALDFGDTVFGTSESNCSTGVCGI